MQCQNIDKLTLIYRVGAVNMPDMESVGTAILMTLGLVVVSLMIVGGLMWALYRFFKNKDE